MLVLDLAAVVALAAAVLAYAGGGDRLAIGPLALGLRDWMRPLTVGLVLLAARLYLDRRTMADQTIGSRSGTPSPVRIILLALCLASVGYWAVFLTTVCGGADSYGYVSASLRMLSGSLVEPQEIARWLPVPDPLTLLAPFGYRPSADLTGTVPAYPLGLPAFMALLTAAFGPVGAYLVPPIAGVVSLVLVARIGAAWDDETTGLVAAALTAWNPLFIDYAKQPMSDVPATMWFLAGLWCLVRTPRRPALGGVAAGLSFVTRPGGIGAIAALCLLTLATASPPAPTIDRLKHAAWFAAGCVPFGLFQAGMQWWLFGSPFTTGYGLLSDLYAGGAMGANLALYATAIWQVHHVVGLAALVAAAIFARRRDVLVWALVTMALVGIPYVLYFNFTHWETLRFLLPGVVLLGIAGASGITGIARRLSPPWLGCAVICACVLAVAGRTTAFLAHEGVPGWMEGEQRYPRAAAGIAQVSRPSAVVLAVQHSGSMRHYSGRTTVRWDLMRIEDLLPVLDAVAAQGREAFVVLEGIEQEQFRQKFAAPLGTVSLLPLGSTHNVRLFRIVKSH